MSYGTITKSDADTFRLSGRMLYHEEILKRMRHLNASHFISRTFLSSPNLLAWHRLAVIKEMYTKVFIAWHTIQSVRFMRFDYCLGLSIIISNACHHFVYAEIIALLSRWEHKQKYFEAENVFVLLLLCVSFSSNEILRVFHCTRRISSISSHTKVLSFWLIIYSLSEQPVVVTICFTK